MTKREGMTVKHFSDFLKLAEEGTEAAENEQVRKADDPDMGEDFEMHRSIRWGLIIFFTVLALIIGGVLWQATSDEPADSNNPTSQPGEQPGEPPGGPSGSQTTTPTDGSVFVAPPELLGSWVDADGSTGYEFRADGTYTVATLDSSSEGRYKTGTDNGVSHVVFLDPNDPTGMTALMIADYRVTDGSLWMTLLGNEREFVNGPLPETGSAGPPVVDLDAATASSMHGRIEAGQPLTVPGFTSYMTQTVDVTSVTGSITINAVTGEVEGRLEAHFECSADRCGQPGETASGDIVIDVVDTRPSTYMQDTWAFEGTAHVRVVFNASSVQAETAYPWSWVDDLEGTYYVGLEREWAVFDITLRVPGDDAKNDEVIALQVIGPTTPAQS